MERRYTLLINDEHKGVVCWKGEGTVDQVKKDIEELVGKKGIEPERLEVIPVIGSRLDLWKVGAVLGLIGLTVGVIVYEGLHKRARKGRREHSDS